MKRIENPSYLQGIPEKKGQFSLIGHQFPSHCKYECERREEEKEEEKQESKSIPPPNFILYMNFALWRL
jgi:hypothetical protein